MSPVRNLKVVICALAAGFTLLAGTGCGRKADVGGEHAGNSVPEIMIVYPRNLTVFPPEIPAPTFAWTNTGPRPAEWAIVVRFGDSGETLTFPAKQSSWRPPPETWRTIKKRSVKSEVRVTVTPVRSASSGSVAPAGSVAFRTSAEPVGAPILYRDVPLPFIYAVLNPDTIRWRLMDVSCESEPPVVLQNLPVCGNCHSLDAAGKTLGMDIDYANDKGSYVITELTEDTVLSRDKIITWNDYRREDGDGTFGLLSRISPDGRYVVSTVKDRSVFVPMPDLHYSQLFFPIKGILAVYDRSSKQFAALPGADDPRYVQSSPEWSPDGQWIYFCRAEAANIPEAGDEKSALITTHLAREFSGGKRPFKYDVYRVPFNGGRGGKAEPVAGASRNGRSNFFPRISPDGKWLAFCQAGNFMLLQPDSTLYIVPSAGGDSRRMNCNTGSMNSWHSWSPNGRWLVFAVKERGAHTQLCLTHVDDAGNDSPPVFLEQIGVSDRACNIPEFVNIRPGAKLAMREHFLDADNFRRQGQVLLQYGEVVASIPLFRKALQLNPDDNDSRLRLAVAYSDLGRSEAAESEFNLLRDRLEKKGDRDALYQVHSHMALHYRHQERILPAIESFHKCLVYKPDDVDARLFLALIHATRREFAEARKYLGEVIARKPDSSLAHMWLGKVLEDTGAPDKAQEHLAKALAGTSEKQSDWATVAERLMSYPRLSREMEAFLMRYRAKYPESADGHVLLAKFYLTGGNVDGAIAELASAKKKDASIPWVDAKLAELRDLRDRKGGTERPRR